MRKFICVHRREIGEANILERELNRKRKNNGSEQQLTTRTNAPSTSHRPVSSEKDYCHGVTAQKLECSRHMTWPFAQQVTAQATTKPKPKLWEQVSAP